MRSKYMSDHLNVLEKNKFSIQAAGPLQDTENNQPAGGLGIISANDLKSAQKLVEGDPFWPTGLRKSVRILEWTQVFTDGRRDNE
ncbi:MAG: hypothetical protein ACI845_000997 [Gammaproteobacteria bacterium]|jgi:uncharacterized protein YciI